jgi:demethylmenaquinone methyltransferase/2-methoxy-6-polyprenyl-1,4-benzoquinol methylase
VSTVVLMRILESAPDRYDAGMRWLSLGAIPRAHRRVAELATREPGARVVEIGCGTGAVTELLLLAGAEVHAFDQSPEMLDRARARLKDVRVDRLTLSEATAAEMDALAAASAQVVVASLVLSEMSSSERAWVLAEVVRILEAGGRFVVADEVRPYRLWQRVLHRLVRVPLALLTWIVVGAPTHALPDLTGELARAGLVVVREERNRLGTMAVVEAERVPAEVT